MSRPDATDASAHKHPPNAGSSEDGADEWASRLKGCLESLAAGDSASLKSLVHDCLEQRTAGDGAPCARLIALCLGRSPGADEHYGTAIVVQVCLDRLQSDDETAWEVLQEITFEQVVKKAELIIRSRISRSNPMITGNAVAGEVYLRLHKAMRENKSAVPTTARQYFGLAAQNIVWQLGDMLRKPKNMQADSIVFEDLAASVGAATNAEQMEAWRRFWEAVDELPEPQREVFDLLWVHGLSQYETATQLGIKRDRVKDLWRDARLAIAEKCSGELSDFLG